MQRNEDLQAIFDNWGPLKRCVHAYFAQHFGQLQLSPAQLEILKTIKCSQPLSHKALAQKMQLTPGGVTQLLEGLEEAGFLTRAVDPADRRVVYLSLSPTGEQKLKAFHKVGKQLLSEVFSTLEDEELAVYLQVQQKLLTRLEAYQQQHPNQKEEK
ncbi:MAG: MarR family transcriptional regulator [Candidatus Saccharibacteria bacterium]|nr:MarR family transcriptional regulator [Candidatus Saccharibacteria bacterium]